MPEKPEATRGSHQMMSSRDKFVKKSLNKIRSKSNVEKFRIENNHLEVDNDFGTEKELKWGKSICTVQSDQKMGFPEIKAPISDPMEF